MIRNGRPRYLWAQEERARLSARWRVYPEGVRHCLNVLLREHGLAAARLASEALDCYTSDLLAAKEGHGDATPGS